MSAYSPDLTGLSWDYYFSTYQRTIFKYPQKVVFEVPVFHNERLEVTKLGVVPEVLEEAVGYTVYDDDIDYDAISVCKNIDATFDKILLKSITLLGFRENSFKVQLKFNQLFSDSINYARINQLREIEVTPILIANMVEKLEYLQQMVLDGTENFTLQSSEARLVLSEHPDGDSEDNLIVNEIHDVNTLSAGNRCLIRPIYGSFFRDSAVVKNSATEEVFVPEIDFVVIDVDFTKTKITSNESGVFRIIKIIKPFVGQVLVTYRAYGGEVDVLSMQSAQDRLKIIENYLTKTSYITPKTLPADPTVISIRNKLQEIEGNMRLLLQNGSPYYNDVTSGTAVLKKVTSQDDSYHWWSIATLYRVEGSSDDILSDVFKFRLKSQISRMMFECAAVVDTTGNGKRFDVTCLNSNVPVDTLSKYYPKLRIIEVSAGGVYSGVVLQLGMKLGGGILQETFDIEDMSGRESCWKLIAFSPTSTPPEDTGVLMPNRVSIFSKNESTALVDEATIPFVDGLNILNSSANFPIQLGVLGSTLGSTENFEMVVQEVGNISLEKAKIFEVLGVFNISQADEKKVVFNIPICSKDTADKCWYGTKFIPTANGAFDFQIKLWYSEADNAYKIGYYVATDVSDALLNVVSTKLMF